MSATGLDLQTFCSEVRHANHYTTVPPHRVRDRSSKKSSSRLYLGVNRSSVLHTKKNILSETKKEGQSWAKLEKVASNRKRWKVLVDGSACE